MDKKTAKLMEEIEGGIWALNGPVAFTNAELLEMPFVKGFSRQLAPRPQLFPVDGEQVWVASNGISDVYFATPEAAKEFLRNRYTGQETAFEEVAEGGQNMSALLARPTVLSQWEDTDWRVWRER